jgi:hypothetical protein
MALYSIRAALISLGAFPRGILRREPMARNHLECATPGDARRLVTRARYGELRHAGARDQGAGASDSHPSAKIESPSS